MAKLREKILQSLTDSTQVEATLNILSKSQENLLKNHSNPVFNKKDKDKILSGYVKLDNIGKSLYRYNKLQEESNYNEAKKEIINLENNVLKTGISYNKYIWHSENGENTCKVCASLDGKEFDFYDEVPERPHPNCKCYVEIVKYNNNDVVPPAEEEEEPCDAIHEINIITNEMEVGLEEMKTFLVDAESEIQELEKDVLNVKKMIKEADRVIVELSEEYGKHLSDCKNNIDNEYGYMYAKKAEWLTLLHDIYGLLNPIRAFLDTFKIFISNYTELLYHAYILKQYEMDKYYHSKANCEATQAIGFLGQKSAEILSNAKEYYDQFTYVHTHRVTIEEAIADSERDQVANRLGRERGRKYPYCDCAILMYDLLPDSQK